jgi:hypothetical protein
MHQNCQQPSVVQSLTRTLLVTSVISRFQNVLSTFSERFLKFLERFQRFQNVASERFLKFLERFSTASERCFGTLCQRFVKVDSTICQRVINVLSILYKHCVNILNFDPQTHPQGAYGREITVMTFNDQQCSCK